MCECRKRCHKPEKLTGKPEACSPEQIRQCHGDATTHPCVTDEGCSQPPSEDHE